MYLHLHNFRTVFKQFRAPRHGHSCIGAQNRFKYMIHLDQDICNDMNLLHHAIAERYTCTMSQPQYPFTG